MGHIREFVAGTWLLVMVVTAVKMNRSRRLAGLMLASAGVFAWGWTSESGVAWGCLLSWALVGWGKPGTRRSQTPLLILGVLVGAAAYWRGADVAAGAFLGLAVGYLVLYGLPVLVPVGGRVMPHHTHALVCSGRACRRRGADWIHRGLVETGSGRDGMRITAAHCLGACQEGPVVLLEPCGRLLRRVRIQDLAMLREWGGSREN